MYYHFHLNVLEAGQSRPHSRGEEIDSTYWRMCQRVHGHILKHHTRQERIDRDLRVGLLVDLKQTSFPVRSWWQATQTLHPLTTAKRSRPLELARRAAGRKQQLLELYFLSHYSYLSFQLTPLCEGPFLWCFLFTTCVKSQIILFVSLLKVVRLITTCQ